MTSLFLYDDARARAFEPFASTRPVSEMTAGAALIRNRWESALPSSNVCFIAGPRHEAFDESGARAAAGTVPAGSIVALSRCVPAAPADPAMAARQMAARQMAARQAATCSIWRCGTQLAAVRIKEPIEVAAFADGSLTLEELSTGTGAIGAVTGWWLEEVWDFIRLLPDQLAADLAAPSAAVGQRPADSTILGDQVRPSWTAPSA